MELFVRRAWNDIVNETEILFNHQSTHNKSSKPSAFLKQAAYLITSCLTWFVGHYTDIALQILFVHSLRTTLRPSGKTLLQLKRNRKLSMLLEYQQNSYLHWLEWLPYSTDCVCPFWWKWNRWIFRDWFASIGVIQPVRVNWTMVATQLKLKLHIALNVDTYKVWSAIESMKSRFRWVDEKTDRKFLIICFI